ncbi:8-amino-7-oxononanoate synthase [Veillonella montpellierensis DNF00314]|uniref:8-amino-7-ketopelargonate synthase n=1 Tax=Veillonella montpellierensis DNF00314 TaxID=1401067 RepID=A0A096ALZ7_9FIRM|nr:8-amino-7-oxononanoate synthase [Veillonella montpellierensis]KGF47671.1 8-amino-7-oxononanoate synthase [Veillonella montpellierensis DNF00314]
MNLIKYITLLENKRIEKLYRHCTEYYPKSPSTVVLEGKEYVMMASNNYLGLTHHPKVIQAAIRALETYGTGSGGSRLINGTHKLFTTLEKELATYKETEKALVFNTGYMANVGTISALMGKDDLIFSDALNHASIIDGCRMSKANIITYEHCNMNDLEKKLQSYGNQSQNKLIVTDGVFSMDGDIAPLDKLVWLKEKYNSLLMVDDAHATGVIGNGKGSAHHYHLDHKVDIQLGTLSKALGSVGGFVATNSIISDYLINTSRPFIFSTALAPANIGAALAALELIESDTTLIDKLYNNVKYLSNRLQRIGLLATSHTPIFPIIVGDAEKALRLSDILKENGIIVTAIRPPTVPKGESRLRLTVTASHTEEQLNQVVDAFISIFNDT